MFYLDSGTNLLVVLLLVSLLDLFVNKVWFCFCLDSLIGHGNIVRILFLELLPMTWCGIDLSRVVNYPNIENLTKGLLLWPKLLTNIPRNNVGLPGSCVVILYHVSLCFKYEDFLRRFSVWYVCIYKSTHWSKVVSYIFVRIFVPTFISPTVYGVSTLHKL